jgi:NADPH:quinone reductase-like Zn-dependent oxidoreductase
MRAYRYHAYGSPPRLEDVPTPRAGDGELLIRVHCAALNPVDWKVADGRFRVLVRGGLPRTMGSDFAGETAAVASSVTGFEIGDRVHGFIDPFRRAAGTFADFVPVPASYVFALPPGMSFSAGAALPCAGITAVQLCDLAGVAQGMRVLVNGAAGGVGHLAVQVARSRGARVTAVSSSPRRDLLASLGAEEFLDYATTPWDRWPANFDAVLDCVPNLPRRAHRRLLARGGRLVATLPGAATYLVDPFTNLIGPIRRRAVMLAPSPGAHLELQRGIASGRIRCVVESEYPLERASAAVERSRTGHVAGKLVIRMTD